MRIAVAGATGRVGQPLVEVLRARGHEVVPIARSAGIDVITGEGLDSALVGVECIVDAATGPSPEEHEATEFFTTSARNVQAAAARAGVQRIVVVSIIGIDPFTGGYGAAKLAHEQAMRAGPVPVRIVRAAQFHEFVGQMMDWSPGDVAYVPNMRTQLVAARNVAEVLADAATDAAPEPAGGWPIVDVAGPREEHLVQAATLLASRRGRPLKVEAVAAPDDKDLQLMESGAMLPGPGALLVGPTFEEWLDAQTFG